MIKEGFNYTASTIEEMSDFFETRVENLKPKEEKNKSSSAAEKSLKKAKKRKIEDPDFSVVESSEESTKACSTSKKHYILHGKCSHSMDSYKDLHAMVNKRRRKLQKLHKEQQRIERSK